MYQVAGVLLFVCCHILCTKSEEIVLTQILYRHGDRAPFNTFPTNPVPPSVWPDGYQQLTQKGMEQHYALGQYFRDRYILGNPYKFLNDTYNRSEVVIQSTDIDRTLMSAYSNLAGFFPPVGRQKWSEEILWQPIPVHTKPVNTDYMLHMGVKCPAYDKCVKEIMSSDEITQLELKNRDFYRYVENKTGLQELNLTNIWKLYDILLCQKSHDFELPTWVNDTVTGESVTVYNKMALLTAFYFDVQFNRECEKRLRGGVLLKQMIENMKTKVFSSEPSPKCYVYSAHDDTIVALLGAMNSFNGLCPPYASAVIVELYKENDTDDLKVRVLFHNSTLPSYNISLPGCEGKQCTLQKFSQLFKDNLPSDWDQECHFQPSSNSPDMKMIGLVVLTVVCVLIMLISICLFISGVRKRSAHQYNSLNNSIYS